MGRSYLPILLAAKMQFRLRKLEEALSESDVCRAEREAEELNVIWSKFGYMAKETRGELYEQIERPLSAIHAADNFTPPNTSALGDQIAQLNSLLKELAG